MRDIARLDDYRIRTDPAPDAEASRAPEGTEPSPPPPSERCVDTSPTAHGRRPQSAPAAPEPLWRDVLGQRLRARRLDRKETLARTAERAGISPQYLSEMERGLKEPSSEMIAAVAGALGVTLPELVGEVARRLASSSTAGPSTSTSTTTSSTVRPSGRPSGARPPQLLATG